MIRIRTREKLKKSTKIDPQKHCRNGQSYTQKYVFQPCFLQPGSATRKCENKRFASTKHHFFTACHHPKTRKKRTQILPKSPKRPKIYPGCLQITIFGTPTGDPIQMMFFLGSTDRPRAAKRRPRALKTPPKQSPRPSQIRFLGDLFPSIFQSQFLCVFQSIFLKIFCIFLKPTFNFSAHTQCYLDVLENEHFERRY